MVCSRCGRKLGRGETIKSRFTNSIYCADVTGCDKQARLTTPSQPEPDIEIMKPAKTRR